MNSIPYVHYSKDKNSLLKTYYIALIPLILFSFYKNGIMLYQNSFISFLDLLIPLCFYLISIGIGILVSYLNKENKWEYILYSLIIACSISINTNKIVYPIVLFIALFTTSYLAKKRDFNFLAASRVIIILALLMGTYSYLNVAEKLNAFNYDIFDLFWGYEISGLATSSLFFLCISTIILFTNRFYKKIILLMASLSFLLIFLILYFITKDTSFLSSLLNGSIYFGFLFVASDLTHSPNTKTGMMIYGLLIGVVTAILGMFLPIYEISYISILLVSFLIPLIDKIIVKKFIK